MAGIGTVVDLPLASAGVPGCPMSTLITLDAGLRLPAVAESLDMLIGDVDRSTAVGDLRHHFESGRLTLEEFEARLAEVNTARTRGDLEHAFRQLPLREPPVSLRVRDIRWSSLALQYGLCNLVCILIWVFSGAQGSFWPKWVLVGTLIVYVRRLRHRSTPVRELPRAHQQSDENT